MEITVQQVELLSDDDYIYLDVRGEIAYQHGHIPKAYEWAGDFSHIEELPKDKRLIVYCNYGEKSAPIAEQLRQEGYEALNLSGGYREWLLHVTSQKEQMQDVSKDGLHLFSSTEELTPDEVKRYDRQIILPQVGSDGQKKLKKSKVLIIGAGGLGAPAALYLAGAGVGTIGIVDADDVSVSNLQRQIIHTSKREGTNKAESAKKSMLELNEHIKVNTYPEYLYADNAEELFKEYDFIIDAVDNFETKFLINDTCVLLKKPFCHAGILQFQGQVMTYVPEEDQPCYRCIFEEIPESGSVPNCSQAGIIGAVAGIIGCIQALEAIKYLLGIGELLTALRRSGKTLAVATSKPEPFAVKILEHFGIADRFAYIAGGTLDETRTKKAEVIRYALERLGIPSGLSAVMVGDRKYDIVGARGVGIASIGVLYGYGTRAELSEAGAPFLAADIAELGSLLMPERVP